MGSHCFFMVSYSELASQKAHKNTIHFKVKVIYLMPRSVGSICPVSRARGLCVNVQCPDQIAIWKWCFLSTEVNLRSRKNPQSRERTNNKLGPHEMLSTGQYLGSQWWEASVFLLPHPCSVCVVCINYQQGKMHFDCWVSYSR